MNTLWEKEKMSVISVFSFSMIVMICAISHSVVYKINALIWTSSKFCYVVKSYGSGCTKLFTLVHPSTIKWSYAIYYNLGPTGNNLSMVTIC